MNPHYHEEQHPVSSLFASDQDDPTSPLLSSTDPLLLQQQPPSEQEESSGLMSRILIRGCAHHDDDDDDDVQQQRRQVSLSAVVIIVAGTCCLLQIGWIWGSYLSSSWSDTYLRWTLPSLPSFHHYDALIQTTNLSFLISMLLSCCCCCSSSSSSSLLLLLLILVMATAVVLPCLSMIMTPLWIFELYHHGGSSSIVGQQQQQQQSLSLLSSTFRSLLEWTLRFSLFAVFFLILLDLAWILPISNINNINNNIIALHHRMQLGLVFYVLGNTASLLGVVVPLRSVVPTTNHSCCCGCGYCRGCGCNSNVQAGMESNYKNYDNNSNQNRIVGNSTYAPVLALPSHHPPSLEQQQQQRVLPTTTTTSSSSSVRRRDIGRWRRCLVWETGLVCAVLLLVTSLTLPLFQFNYSGLLAASSSLSSDLMTITQQQQQQQEINVYLWQIPGWLWTSSSISTPTWMLIVTIGGFVLYVFILPLLVLSCGVAAWIVPSSSSRRSTTKASSLYYYRNWLCCLAPTANSITFAVAVITIVPSLQPLMEYMLDQQDAFGLCRKVKKLIPTAGDASPCLMVHGKVLLGTWSLLAHALALELFVVLTLRYCV